MKPTQSQISRREFLRKSTNGALSTGFVIVPRYVLGGPGQTPPSEIVNLAGIGVGGHGAFLLDGMARECGDLARIVAVCDVDEKRASELIVRKIPHVENVGGFKRFPKARRYYDFRRMLEKEEKNIDAVVVATPDHTHAVASVAAMQCGKHVYCEKPLAHDIYEVRRMMEVARKTGVATQMGIGIHSSETFRRVVELIRAGAIGEVKEVHAWCDNAPGMGKDDTALPWGDRRPPQRPPVPKTLHWDLWLGPAPYRPYHPAYLPVRWRSWWDFGNGRLGDMGCHLLDLVFWALDLNYPETVEAEGPKPPTREVAPLWMSVVWTFPARGNRPPVTFTWHHGIGRRPPIAKEVRLPDWPIAVLFVGSKGLLVVQIEVIPPRYKLLPEEEYTDFQPPRPSIPRSRGHYREWLLACKGGPPALCHFDYSGPITETVLLGCVAYRTGEKLQWDAQNLKATNCAEAERFIRCSYRKGWTL